MRRTVVWIDFKPRDAERFVNVDLDLNLRLLKVRNSELCLSDELFNILKQNDLQDVIKIIEEKRKNRKKASSLTHYLPPEDANWINELDAETLRELLALAIISKTQPEVILEKFPEVVLLIKDGYFQSDVQCNIDRVKIPEIAKIRAYDIITAIRRGEKERLRKSYPQIYLLLKLGVIKKAYL